MGKRVSAIRVPAQEIRKFGGRLRGLGAGAWPRGTKVLELFCGRGNGLRALAGLGFWDVFGVDLSPTLVARSPARGRLVVADCRRLPFAAASREVAVVQGGLHHLMRLPGDLEETLAEVRRVLGRGDAWWLLNRGGRPFCPWSIESSPVPTRGESGSGWRPSAR